MELNSLQHQKTPYYERKAPPCYGGKSVCLGPFAPMCDNFSRPRDPVSIPGQSVQFVGFAWFYVSLVVSLALRDVLVGSKVRREYVGRRPKNKYINKKYICICISICICICICICVYAYIYIYMYRCIGAAQKQLNASSLCYYQSWKSLHCNKCAATLMQRYSKITAQLPHNCSKIAATLPHICYNIAAALPHNCRRIAAQLLQNCCRIAAQLFPIIPHLSHNRRVVNNIVGSVSSWKATPTSLPRFRHIVVNISHFCDSFGRCHAQGRVPQSHNQAFLASGCA